MSKLVEELQNQTSKVQKIDSISERDIIIVRLCPSPELTIGLSSQKIVSMIGNISYLLLDNSQVLVKYEN